jgi:hypothetical protein
VVNSTKMDVSIIINGDNSGLLKGARFDLKVN